MDLSEDESPESQTEEGDSPDEEPEGDEEGEVDQDAGPDVVCSSPIWAKPNIGIWNF
ncbi:Hypothetical predicted protein [Xyrichtys novacula]|uniref:Uncharacterized protein n=1 Tax=Xyrichtys novacula TaxID=13765 RepID=A0AAV1HIC4_XYRNO|nr:Hypothetical predicted protein [Xyrichtys novacula]